MALMDDIGGYWDLRSGGFSDCINNELDNNGERWIDQITGDLGMAGGSRILDIGCGPGMFSILLHKAGFEVTGVDYSKGMLLRARENAASRSADIVFMRMDAQDLKFGDSVFDAVVSRDVIWNLEHPERAYAEMTRVVRPGGRILVYDGNYYSYLFDGDGRPAAPKDDGRSASRKNGHGKFNTDNVDFGIIESLAHDLPCGRLDRPSWDIGILEDLGMSAEVLTPGGHGQFIIRAEKAERT